MIDDLRGFEERAENALDDLINADLNSMDAAELIQLFADRDIALVPIETANELV